MPTLIEIIREASVDLMWHYATTGNDGYRQWFYTGKYEISKDAQNFIENGILTGKSAKQIFEASKQAHA